ncbi:ATPase, AFG1 family [uncultured Candidatus Thioglobus sp.]|nr:ATPase, AFG1 family [uncultured Candidatus Thioglobus sp.]
MTPLEKYQADLLAVDFYADSAQAEVVQQIEELFHAIVAARQLNNNMLHKVKLRFSRDNLSSVTGLYLWGGVGRGKTYLLDSLYDCLPFVEKKRIHFYRFMQMVHAKLKTIKDQKDPLQIVADSIATDTHVLCLDEFHVNDIADAMLLGELLKALFAYGCTILMTSNEAPERLYWDGLQRQRFLPVIDLIGKYMEVVNLDSNTDYRLCFLDKTDRYRPVLDDKAHAMLQKNFNHIASGDIIKGKPYMIQDRMVDTVQYADRVIWFEFNALCGAHRGVADYIEISMLFHTVMIANVPIMDDEMNDEAKRFIACIDEFYDQAIKLIITAATTPQSIYIGKRLAQSFLRTTSRLEEMQAHAYLER